MEAEMDDNHRDGDDLREMWENEALLARVMQAGEVPQLGPSREFLERSRGRSNHRDAPTWSRFAPPVWIAFAVVMLILARPTRVPDVQIVDLELELDAFDDEFIVVEELL
jgi:hypothetical protein